MRRSFPSYISREGARCSDIVPYRLEKKQKLTRLKSKLENPVSGDLFSETLEPDDWDMGA